MRPNAAFDHDIHPCFASDLYKNDKAVNKPGILKNGFILYIRIEKSTRQIWANVYSKYTDKIAPKCRLRLIFLTYETEFVLILAELENSVLPIG